MKQNSTTKNIARWISLILNPLLFQVLLYYQCNDISVWQYLTLCSILFLFPFVAYFAYVKWYLNVKDLYILERRHRFIPFLTHFIAVVSAFAYIQSIVPPQSCSLIVWSFSSSVAIISAFFTLFWRISLHAIGVSATLFYFLNPIFPLQFEKIIPIFLIIILVGWSRLVLKAHTPMQVIAGSILGAFWPYVFHWLLF